MLSTGLFRNRVSNLGLVTQNVQWLLLLGTAFVVSAYLQVVRGYNAIETGVIFTAATGGILASSLAAERLAKKRAQRTLIIAGFIITIAGVVVLLALVNGSPSVWAFAPGLLLIGLGVGVMLTPSVNVVQSSFPEERQGEISGLSRSVSNLGSCLGTAIGGTILVSGLTSHAYGAAMIVLAAIGLIGLVAALFLPTSPPNPTDSTEHLMPGPFVRRADRLAEQNDHRRVRSRPSHSCARSAILRAVARRVVAPLVPGWVIVDGLPVFHRSHRGAARRRGRSSTCTGSASRAPTSSRPPRCSPPATRRTSPTCLGWAGACDRRARSTCPVWRPP